MQVAAAPSSNQAPTSTGGAGAAGETKTKASPSTPGQNIPAQPSAQLQSYLNANQPQAQQMAQNVATTVGNQVSSAANAINPAIQAYTGNLYTVPTDQTVNNLVAQSPSQLTAEQQATYTKELNAANNLPNSAATFETTQPYADLTSQIQSAVSLANLWNQSNNPSSISTAIRPFETQNPSYGDVTLDALLLSQIPGAYNQIQSSAAPAANLQNQLASGATTADKALQDAIAADISSTAAANAAPQAYAQNLKDYISGVQQGIAPGIIQQNNVIAKDVASGNLNQSDLANLGITQEQWDSLVKDISGSESFGAQINLANYLAQTSPQITAAEAATPTQYLDVAKLQNMLGTNAPVFPISPSESSQSQQFPDIHSLNKFDLSSAEQAAQKVPSLESQANDLLNTKAWAWSQYFNNNHFGGQSQSQMNDYLTNLTRQVDAINAQIVALGGTPVNQNSLYESVPAANQNNPSIFEGAPI
jgi:hypothetical protein